MDFTSKYNTYPICKDGQDEFPRHESVENPLDDLEVRCHGDVALEADVGELRLGGDVDGHVLAQAKVLRFLQLQARSEINLYFSRGKTSCLVKERKCVMIRFVYVLHSQEFRSWSIRMAQT